MKWFVILTSVFIFVITFYPTYHHWRSTPTDRVWSGTTFYSDDYAVYVHTIHQGVAGRWTVVDKFTSELHDGSLLHIYYLLAGKLFGIFGLHPITIYHLLRVIASITFLFAAWNFTKSVLSNKFHQLTAWLLILFANSLSVKYFMP